MKTFMKNIYIIFYASLFCFLSSSAFAEMTANDYRDAAKLGGPQAQNAMGICYEHGYGVSKDMKKALQWYQRSAQQGYAWAFFNIGKCYRDGRGVEKNPAEAFTFYQKAAAQGLSEGIFEVGRCYEDGIGTEKNLQNAVASYTKAAKQKYSPAATKLGICYINGTGVEKNLTKGAAYLQKAAQAGDAEGQYLFGNCYENGIGVQKNSIEAMNWYTYSGRKGFPQAKQRLMELSPAGNWSDFSISIFLPPQDDYGDDDGGKQTVWSFLANEAMRQLSETNKTFTFTITNTSSTKFENIHFRVYTFYYGIDINDISIDMIKNVIKNKKKEFFYKQQDVMVTLAPENYYAFEVNTNDLIMELKYICFVIVDKQGKETAYYCSKGDKFSSMPPGDTKNVGCMFGEALPFSKYIKK